MENQQGTTKDQRLAWLAGFMDGEGTFTMFMRAKGKYNARIGVNNTCADMTVQVVSILEEHDIPYYLQVMNHGSLRKHKPVWHIEVNRNNAIAKLCDLLIPYLVGKRSQAILVQAFTLKRALRGYHEGASEEMIEMANACRLLNKKGPSETIRQPLLRDDIVRTARKLVESYRNVAPPAIQ